VQIDAGNTAWVLVSAALVMLMTPGLALFYGGMVRAKHVVAMLVQNCAAMAVAGLAWVAVAYSLAFGASTVGGLIGDLHFAGLGHMDQIVPGYVGALGQSIPPMAFAAFQLMFAGITPALFTGSIAERARLGPFLVLVALWTALVYAPVAHWVFSPQGWLFGRGAEDFAGGTVVHVNAGAAGLALAIVLGKRRDLPRLGAAPAHNLPLVVLGAGLLWFGWFGFNAGSALGANVTAAVAFVNTNTAAAAGLLAWLCTERLRSAKPTALGAASGAVAGLVAITPAAGYVEPMGALFIGLLAGWACCLAVGLKHRLKVDDTLDVVGIHLAAGALGAIAIGFLGTSSVGGVNGLLHGGGAHLLVEQVLAVAVVVTYSFGATLALGLAIHRLMGLRATPSQEEEGLDLALHGETAYALTDGGAVDLDVAIDRLPTLEMERNGSPQRPNE
jgi:Amt family ammonium transporter